MPLPGFTRAVLVGSAVTIPIIIYSGPFMQAGIHAEST